MPTDRWRRRATGLRARLVAFCLVLAAISIGATAWIAAESTSSSLNEQYTQNVRSVTAVYSTLSDYAATHRSWTGVATVVDTLAARNHMRVVLRTESGAPIADSSSTGSALTGVRPAAIINPLQPDRSIGNPVVLGGVDARVVGPYAISTNQQAVIRRAVLATRACLARHGHADAPVHELPNGRLDLADDPDMPNCGQPAAAVRATATEQIAGQRLLPALARCIPAPGVDTAEVLVVVGRKSKIVLRPSSADFLDALGNLLTATTGTEQECVIAARRAQLAPYVAPAAQLYLATSVTTTRPGLTDVGRNRILGFGAAILVATLAICYVAATRLRRPLVALNDAVARTARGERPGLLSPRGTSEMQQLANAVNDLAVQLDLAERRRQDMVADIAHELRTPLGNVRGWLEAVQDGVLPADSHAFDRIHGQALVLQHLIDDLQDLALADAGQLAVHPERLDMAVAVRDVVTAVQLGDAAGVTITWSASGDTMLDADPVRVRQVIANLLSNAQRATTSGQISVAAVGEPDNVVITVADTGSGISADDLPHLFDRFWRADRSRSRARGGSGLGLAITHALVTAHDGDIVVVSKPSRGTIVTVQLPKTHRHDVDGRPDDVPRSTAR